MNSYSAYRQGESSKNTDYFVITWNTCNSNARDETRYSEVGDKETTGKKNSA